MEGKCDLFTRMCDRRDIVDFVKEIERNPCLYDVTLPAYANKAETRRAWSVIAKKINTTVPDCRDKWRKIRISFMRSLKQQQSDKPPMRPYYLAEDLAFLRPFLKINSKTPSQKENSMDFETTVLKRHEISTDSECSDPIEIAENFEEIEHERSKETFRDTIIKENPKQVIYVKQNSRNSYEDETQYERNNYNGVIENNPRKMFLLSLLPDVQCFTEPEMRIFRREVIRACDNIMNRRII